MAATTSGLTSATATASVYAGTYGDAVLTDGAVGYWPLGGTTGTAANKVTGSGALPALTYDGTSTAGSAPTTTLGGSSTDFGPTSGYATATAPSTIAGGYTVLGWVNVAACPTYNDGEPVIYGNFFYYGRSGVGINSSCDFTTIYDGVGWKQTTTAMPLNTWAFVAVTMTTGGTATYYVDGTAVAATSSAIGGSNLILLSQASSGRHLPGSEAQVAYFNSVLTKSQIDQLYSLSK